MNQELLYLIKANVAIAVLYFFYRLLLQKETYYQWNRYYFLFAVPLSFLFPVMDFSYVFSSAQVLAIQHLAPVFPVDVSGKDSGFTLVSLIFLVMASGTGVLITRLSMQLYSLWKAKQCSEKAPEYNHCHVRYMHTITNPFSFFRTIYVNPGLHGNKDIEAIMDHECIHVKEMHSFDIIFYELTCAFCWYNPFIWLMKQSVRQNIEFQTDKQILKAGYDRRHYQHELLKVSQIPSFLEIANNFNFNYLKQRIIMMNKKQSGPAGLLKFAVLVPLFAGMTLMANTPGALFEKNQSTEDQIKIEGSSGANVTVNKSEHDFGTIKESEGDASTVFTISNTSKEPMVIKDVKASCGCTTPEWTKEPIAPGKTGYLKVTYGAKNRPGPFNKTVTANLSIGNDNLSTIFHIKGTVVSE